MITKFYLYQYLVFVLFILSTSFVYNTLDAHAGHKKKRHSFVTRLFNDTFLSYFSGNFHTVQGGVCYRSGQLSPKRLKRYIKRHNIKSVLNLRGENPQIRWWQREKATIDELGLAFYNVPLNTLSMPSKKHVADLLTIFKEAPRPLLIHCQHGSDRTGMVSALWALEEMKQDLKSAKKQLSFLSYGHIPFLCYNMKRFIKRWYALRTKHLPEQALALYEGIKKKSHD